MGIARDERDNNKRTANAAVQSTLSHPPSKHKASGTVQVITSLPIPIPPGTAAAEFEHIFMDHCEFRPSPVHGYGVFATKDIPPKTLIMKEKALWVVTALTAIMCTVAKSEDYEVPRRRMIESFYHSNPEVVDDDERVRLQLDILALCGGFSEDERLLGDATACKQTLSERLREVLILNGVTESGDGSPEYAAVFRAASRLNHSCAPNAERMRSKVQNGSVVSSPFPIHGYALTRFPILTTLVQYAMVYATSFIKKGEEIFINYVDPLARSDFRQKLFQSRWNFTCTCRLCTRPKKEIEASDDRREKIDQAMSRMMEAQKKHAEPKPKWQSETSYNNHLAQCDKVTLGEAGWEVLEKFAAKEGVADLKLFNR